MIKSLFVFTVMNCKPDFGSDYNEARFREFLKGNEGKKFEIHRKERKRTISQNAYYWVYLELIEGQTGNAANDLHELFRRTLLPPKFITVMGKEIKIPRSTTELNKVEFAEYLEKICAETKVPLLDPIAAGYIR